MSHAHGGPRPSSLGRTLTQALVFSLIPLGTAFAQSYPFVRVTRDAEISSLRLTHEVRTKATKGTVFEVFYVEGDPYRHRESNWYWVLLPEDKWGSRPAGWIRGEDVEHVAAPATTLAQARVADAPAGPSAKPTQYESTATSMPTGVRETAVAADAPVTSRPFVSDVVLNFEFGKSTLTDEAKRKLASAVSIPKPGAQLTAVALEGHADWIGTETYNEELGLARAESVRRYLHEQLQIPVDRISVISYGENNPAATNKTRKGRAQNRRVVIRNGA